MPLHFVYDNLGLATGKSNTNPPGPDPTKEVDATHWNDLCAAADDLRNVVTLAKYLGFSPQNADPAPANSPRYLWLKADDVLVFKVPGKTYYLASIEASVKGDLAVFDGTKFVKLATGGAPSDGKFLQADSAQASGVKWGTGAVVENPAVSTVDNTPTILWSKALSDNSVYLYVLRIIARRTNGVDSAHFVVEVAVSTAGGAITIHGVHFQMVESTDAVWAVTFDAAGLTLRAKVAGANGKNINWMGAVASPVVVA